MCVNSQVPGELTVVLSVGGRVAEVTDQPENEGYWDKVQLEVNTMQHLDVQMPTETLLVEAYIRGRKRGDTVTLGRTEIPLSCFEMGGVHEMVLYLPDGEVELAINPINFGLLPAPTTQKHSHAAPHGVPTFGTWGRHVVIYYPQDYARATLLAGPQNVIPPIMEYWPLSLLRASAVNPIVQTQVNPPHASTTLLSSL